MSYNNCTLNISCNVKLKFILSPASQYFLLIWLLLQPSTMLQLLFIFLCAVHQHSQMLLPFSTLTYFLDTFHIPMLYIHMLLHLKVALPIDETNITHSSKTHNKKTWRILSNVDYNIHLLWQFSFFSFEKFQIKVSIRIMVLVSNLLP
jgi:hypothetical protein